MAADEREDRANRRGRATLNYGHTLAHALETGGRYDLRHGEAVAIGLVYAAELAHRLGRIDRRAGRRAPPGGRAYGLRTDLPAGVDPDELLVLMARDKKAVDGLTFVLDGPDGRRGRDRCRPDGRRRDLRRRWRARRDRAGGRARHGPAAAPART